MVFKNGFCIGLACAASILAGGSAIAQPAPSQKMLEMSVVETTPSLSGLPLLAMQQIAGEYNMKITLIAAQGGGQSGQIFVGGSGDAMLVGIDTPVAFMAQHLLDVKVTGIILTELNWGLIVAKDSPIKTVADLKGKTVGISAPGALSELGLLWGLKTHGVDPTTVKRVALGGPTAIMAALDNRKVDATMIDAAALQFAVDSGDARKIEDWASEAYPADVFVERTKDLEARRPDFVRFHALFAEAMRRMKNPDFALKIARMRTPPNIPDDQLKAQVARQIATVWSPMTGVMTEPAYKNATDIWVASGRFKASEIPSFSALAENMTPTN